MEKILYQGSEYDKFLVSENPLIVTVKFDVHEATPLMRIGGKWTVLDSSYLPSGANIGEIGKLIEESFDWNKK